MRRRLHDSLCKQARKTVLAGTFDEGQGLPGWGEVLAGQHLSNWLTTATKSKPRSSRKGVAAELLDESHCEVTIGVVSAGGYLDRWRTGDRPSPKPRSLRKSLSASRHDFKGRAHQTRIVAPCLKCSDAFRNESRRPRYAAQSQAYDTLRTRPADEDRGG